MVSQSLVDPYEECEGILQEAGFSMLHNSTVKDLHGIVYQVIESSPKLQEKLAEVKEDGEITPQERHELIVLFEEAYEANKSIYQPQVRAVLREIPRSIIHGIKAKIVATWNRVKDFFKKAWRKVTGKSGQNSIREKRLATLAFIGISMVFVGIYMVFIVLKATGHRMEPHEYYERF